MTLVYHTKDMKALFYIKALLSRFFCIIIKYYNKKSRDITAFGNKSVKAVFEAPLVRFEVIQKYAIFMGQIISESEGICGNMIGIHAN